MTETTITGLGRKRPQLDIEIEKLHLDSQNPRLPEEIQGKSENEVLKVLYKDFNLDELAESMSINGYFDEEPLVAIPQALPKELKNVSTKNKKFIDFIKKRSTRFLVVEGNRRLASAKLLLDNNLRDEYHIKHWPKINVDIENDLRKLPVIIYRDRNQVIPYLGVRHIIGIQKWGSYAKARYIARLIESGYTLKQIEELVADDQNAVKKSYISYKMLEQAKLDFDYDTSAAKNNFSFIILAIGHRPIKQFLGIAHNFSVPDPSEVIPDDKLENLEMFLSWIYGDKNKKRQAVIKESRDITNYITKILQNDDALQHLIDTRNLLEANELIYDEEVTLIRHLKNANSRLRSALGLAHSHKTSDVIDEIQKCKENIDQLLKSVK